MIQEIPPINVNLPNHVRLDAVGFVMRSPPEGPGRLSRPLGGSRKLAIEINERAEVDKRDYHIGPENAVT